MIFSPLDEKKGNGFEEVLEWIKGGDCVVLHQQGYNSIVYHSPNSKNPNPKLVIVDINPQFSLLDEEEWPSFLKIAGYTSVPLDKEKVAKIGCKEIETYKFGYED